MHAHCPVASEVSGEVSEVSAMRKIGQLQGQRARRPYTSSTRFVFSSFPLWLALTLWSLA